MPEKSTPLSTLVDTLKMMRDQYYDFRNHTISGLKNKHGITSTDILFDIYCFHQNEIESGDPGKFKKFLMNYINNAEDKLKIEETENDDIIDIMKTIKEVVLSLDVMRKQIEDLEKESFNIVNGSVSNTEKIRKKIEHMNELLEKASDPLDKSKILAGIKSLESAISYDFLRSRFKRFGKKEIKNIEEGFFNSKKGTYIIEKYRTNSVRFEFNPNIFFHFFNIEETFLPEEYHPFNNLFLYIYMRAVAYADVHNRNDRLFISSLSTAIESLFYHKFLTKEEEDVFINIIKEILDNFAEDIEYFEKNNKTYKKNPFRINADEKLNKERKEKALRRVELFNIDCGTNIPIDELEKIIKDTFDNIRNNQIRDYEKAQLIGTMIREEIKGYDKDAPLEELKEFYEKEIALRESESDIEKLSIDDAEMLDEE